MTSRTDQLRHPERRLVIVVRADVTARLVGLAGRLLELGRGGHAERVGVDVEERSPVVVPERPDRPGAAR